MSYLYLFLILLAMIGVVAAMEAIFRESADRKKAKDDLRRFEEKYPPKK